MQPAKMTHPTSTARLTKIIVPPSMSIAPNHAPGAKRRVSSLPASTRRSLPRGAPFRDRLKVFNPIGAFFCNSHEELRLWGEGARRDRETATAAEFACGPERQADWPKIRNSWKGALKAG